MPDIEKVIKGLECCLGSNDCDIEPEEDCPYKGMCLCAMALRLDILALLKEQEEGKPKGHWMPYEPDKRGYTDGFTCSRCERVILSDHYCKMIDFDFCPYCGAYMDNTEGR